MVQGKRLQSAADIEMEAQGADSLALDSDLFPKTVIARDLNHPEARNGRRTRGCVSAQLRRLRPPLCLRQEARTSDQSAAAGSTHSQSCGCEDGLSSD